MNYLSGPFGNYYIQAVVGTGSTGVVYRASNRTTKEQVALKIFTDYLTKQPDFEKKLQEEAAVLQNLDHPGLVRVYEAGSVRRPQAGKPEFYLAMELISGGSLQDRLDRLHSSQGALPLEEALSLVQHMAEALQAADEQDIVHHDLKPANILLRRPGNQPVITDFGLARQAVDATATRPNPGGSLAYMAPEQIQGESTDGRTDIYALGIILYQLVTGRLPYDIRAIMDVTQRLSGQFVPPTTVNPALPTAVDTVVQKAMAREPAQRYASGRDLAAAIQAILAPAPVAALPGLGALLRPAHPAGIATQMEMPDFVANIRLPQRIDVQQTWHGGSYRLLIAHQFEEAQQRPLGNYVRIGRDPGNEVVLNDGFISHFHLVLERVGDGFQVIDQGSTNGAYLGSERIPAYEPVAWAAGQSLRIGRYFLQWQRFGAVNGRQVMVPLSLPYRNGGSSQPPGPASLIPLTPLLLQNLGEATATAGPVTISLNPPQPTIDPGQSLNLAITIQNNGEIIEHYLATISGDIPTPWLTIPDQSLPLSPHQAGAIPITITAPPHSQAPAGNYLAAIHLHSAHSHQPLGQTAFTLTINPDEAFNADMHPAQPKHKDTIQIALHNVGNIDSSYTVVISEAHDNINFIPEHQTINVARGDYQTVGIRAEAKKRGWFKTNKYPFAFEAGFNAIETQKLAGELIVPPYIAWWVPIAFIAIMLLGILGVSHLQAEANQNILAAQMAQATAQANLDSVRATAEANENLSAEERATIIAQAQSDNDKATQELEALQGSSPPFFINTAPKTAYAGRLYSYEVIVRDPNKEDSITVEATDLPPWLQFTPSTGLLSGTPDITHLGVHDVTLVATDDSARGYSTIEQFTITVLYVNETPEIISRPVLEADEDELYAYEIVVEDADENDEIVITVISGLPTWLNFVDRGDRTAKLSGTPAQADVGSYDIVIEARDKDGATARQPFVLTVVNVNDPPQFTSQAVVAATEGMLYIYLITAEDEDDDPISFTAGSGLPTWLVLTDNKNGTATLTGTPFNAHLLAGNAFNIQIIARDDQGGQTAQSFTLTVALVNDPPEVASFSKEGQEDVAVAFSRKDFEDHFTDPERQSLATVRITQLPANGLLELKENNNATPVSLNQELQPADLAKLVFAPDKDWHGITSFGWNGSDGEKYASAPANVTIKLNPVNDPPTFVAGLTQIEVSEDAGPQEFLWATAISPGPEDESGQTLTFIVTVGNGNGSLFSNPPAINAVTGLLTFTPAPDQHGIASLTVLLKDDGGGTDTSEPANVTINIQPVNDPPVLSCSKPLSDIDENPVNNPGDTVSELIQGCVTDVDGPKRGIAVIAANSPKGQGVWQYQKVGGSWQDFPQVSASAALLLDEDDSIRFTPALNYSGSAGFIGFKAWDQSRPGNDTTDPSDTPFSADSEQQGLTVNNVNNRPVIGDVSPDPPVTYTFSDAGSEKITDSLAPDARVQDGDSTHNPDFNFNNGHLIVTITPPRGGDRLRIHNQGNGSGQIGVSQNNVQVRYEGNLIGTASYNESTGEVQVDFTDNGNATIAAVTALIRAIIMAYDYSQNGAYAFNAPCHGVRVIEFELDDGTGEANSTSDPPITVRVELEGNIAPAVNEDNGLNLVVASGGGGVTVSAILTSHQGMTSFSDGNCGDPPMGIAITGVSGNDGQDGQWQYCLAPCGNGNVWTDIPPLPGLQALHLFPEASVRFNGTPNGNAGITFRAWDMTNGVANGVTATIPNDFSPTGAYSGGTLTANLASSSAEAGQKSTGIARANHDDSRNLFRLVNDTPVTQAIGGRRTRRAMPGAATWQPTLFSMAVKMGLTEK